MALSGGRFNRYGIPALYLALELSTTVAEYRQAAPFLPPLVDVRHLDREWDPLWHDWEED